MRRFTKDSLFTYISFLTSFNKRSICSVVKEL